jgi:hypothetical protein
MSEINMPLNVASDFGNKNKEDRNKIVPDHR